MSYTTDLIKQRKQGLSGQTTASPKVSSQSYTMQLIGERKKNIPTFSANSNSVFTPVTESKPQSKTFFQQIGDALKFTGKHFVAGVKQAAPGLIAAGELTLKQYQKWENSDQNPYNLTKLYEEKAKKDPAKYQPLLDEQNKNKQKADVVYSEAAKKLREASLRAMESADLYRKTQLPVMEPKKFQEAIKDPKYVAKYLIAGTAENLPSLLSSFGLSAATLAVTKNPQAAFAVGFASSYAQNAGDAYNDAKVYGANEDTAQRVGLTVGIANGILDMLPIERLLKRTGAGEAIKKSIVKEITKSFVKQFAYEGTTESIQEVIANAMARTYEQNKAEFKTDPAGFIKDLAEGAPESFLFGGLLGGVSGAVADVAGAVFNKGTTGSEVATQLDLSIQEIRNKAEAERTPEEQTFLNTVDEAQKDGKAFKTTETLTEKVSNYDTADQFAQAEFAATKDDGFAFITPDKVKVEGTIDGEMVQKYIEDLTKNKELTPVSATEKKGSLIVTDDAYKVAAYQVLKLEMPTIVKGSKPEGFTTLEEIYNQAKQIADANKEAQIKVNTKESSEEVKSVYQTEQAKAANAQLDANSDEMVTKYIEKHGNEVNTDLAVEFFDGYNGKNYADYTQAGARLKALVLQKLLRDSVGKGNKTILITGGGPGSGKSTAVKKNIDPARHAEYPIILDTTLANKTSAEEIRSYIDAGFNVEIAFVVRDPIQSWINGVIPRAKAEGRVLPEGYHIKVHEAAKNNMLQLIERFKDNPAFDYAIYDNTGEPGSVKLADLDFLEKFTYDSNTVKKEIQDGTDEAYRNGTIDKELYDKLTADRKEKKLESLDPGEPQGRPGEGSEPREEVTLSKEDTEIAGLVQEAVAFGDLEAAKDLYDTHIEKGGKLPPLQDIIDQVEEMQQAEIEAVKKELAEEQEEGDPEDPTTILLDIADRLGEHFKARGALWKITGKDRTYRTPDGKALTVGGDAKTAMDRVIYATDIDGFGRNMAVLSAKFDKVFTEIYQTIQNGGIDGADYEAFKQRLQGKLAERRAYSSGRRPSDKSSTKRQKPETKENSQPAAVPDGRVEEAARETAKNLEEAKKFTKESGLEFVVKSFQGYIDRDNTLQKFIDDVGKTFSGVGYAYGGPTINFDSKKAVLKLADDREFTYTIREVYESGRKEKVSSEPEINITQAIDSINNLENKRSQMQTEADKLRELYQETKSGEDLRKWRSAQNEVDALQTKIIEEENKLRAEEQLKKDIKLRQEDKTVDSLDQADINFITSEAKKAKTLDEFIGKMRGSATQYGEYNPRLRTYVKPESKVLGDMEGIDPNTTITVYRGIDAKSISGKTINSGDFVTTDPDDAAQYTSGPEKVISKEVKLKDLIAEYPEEVDITDPSNPVSYELIYSPGAKVKKVTDTKLTEIWNQAKAADKPKIASKVADEKNGQNLMEFENEMLTTPELEKKLEIAIEGNEDQDLIEDIKEDLAKRRGQKTTLFGETIEEHKKKAIDQTNMFATIGEGKMSVEEKVKFLKKLAAEKYNPGSDADTPLGKLREQETLSEQHKGGLFAGGKSHADVGSFAELDTMTSKDGTKIKDIPFPEMVRLAKELLNKYPIVKMPRARKAGNPRGLFISSGDGKIQLNPDIFSDPVQAAKTLAHEMGHLVDYLPEQTLKRGNIFGHIASLLDFLRRTFSNVESEEKIDKLVEQRKSYEKEKKEIRELAEREGRAKEGKGKRKIYNYTEEEKARNKNLAAGINRIKKEIKELQKNSIKLKAIKTEMFNLSAEWRPFTEMMINAETGKLEAVTIPVEKLTEYIAEGKIDEDFLGYRESSKELYADMVSVLLNDPERLKQKAPIFWQLFFENIDRKPDVKEHLFGMWDFLNRPDEEKLTERLNEMYEGFKEAKEKRLEIEEEKKDKRSMREKFNDFIKSMTRQHFIQFDPIYSALKGKDQAAGMTLSQATETRLALEEMLMRRNESFLLLNSVKEEVLTPLEQLGMTTDDDLGIFLKLTRELGDRRDIANPFGMQQGYAQETLDFFIKQLKDKRGYTDEQVKVFTDIARRFREIVHAKVKEATEVGIYSKEFYDEIASKSAETYATFQVVEYIHDNYVSAGIKKAVGTVKPIENPFMSTLLKTLAVTEAIELQKGKQIVVDQLKKFNPEDITEAVPKKLDRFTVGWKPMDGREALELYSDGKKIAYNVDPYIAAMFDLYTPGEIHSIVKVSAAFNKVFKAIVTTYNVSWGFFSNIIRDSRRTYKNLSTIFRAADKDKLTVGEFITTWLKAIPEGVKYQKSEITPLMKEMLENKAYQTPFSSFDPQANNDLAIATILRKFNLMGDGVRNPEGWRKLLTPVRRLLDAIEFAGSSLETTSKVAGYQLVSKRIESGKERGFIVRNYAGTPNFIDGGNQKQIDNNIFVFSNVMFQALRSDIELAKSPTTASGWWMKTFTIDVMPKLLMLAAAAGLLGEALKDMMDKATEYDKTNFIVVPVGMRKNGKVVYFRMPQDETGRLLSAIVWKIGSAVNGDLKKPEQIMSLGAGFLPSVTPVWEIGGGWLNYFQGRNPYDSYRGRLVVDDTTWKAGGLPVFKKMMMWSMNEAGLSQFSTYSDETDTTFDVIMKNTPLLNRMFKSTDYGLKEKEQGLNKQLDQDKARQTLRERELFDKALEKGKSAANSDQQIEIRDAFIKDVVGDGPYDEQKKRKITNLKKKFQIGLVKGTVNRQLDSLIDADSNDYKLELLKLYRPSMKEEEYRDLVTTAYKAGVISEDFIGRIKSEGLW